MFRESPFEILTSHNKKLCMLLISKVLLMMIRNKFIHHGEFLFGGNIFGKLSMRIDLVMIFHRIKGVWDFWKFVH